MYLGGLAEVTAGVLLLAVSAGGDEGTGAGVAPFESNSTSKFISPSAARLQATYFSQAPEK